MPKHYRQCNFCTQNSSKSPNLVIFKANENLKSLVSFNTDNEMFICEDHFKEDDLKPHGETKRLLDGAVPVFLPRQESVTMDHNYVATAPLDMDMVRFWIYNT